MNNIIKNWDLRHVLWYQKLIQLADKALGTQKVEVQVSCEKIFWEIFRKNACNNGLHYYYLTSTDSTERKQLLSDKNPAVKNNGQGVDIMTSIDYWCPPGTLLLQPWLTALQTLLRIG